MMHLLTSTILPPVLLLLSGWLLKNVSSRQAPYISCELVLVYLGYKLSLFWLKVWRGADAAYAPFSANMYSWVFLAPAICLVGLALARLILSRLSLKGTTAKGLLRVGAAAACALGFVLPHHSQLAASVCLRYFICFYIGTLIPFTCPLDEDFYKRFSDIHLTRRGYNRLFLYLAVVLVSTFYGYYSAAGKSMIWDPDAGSIYFTNMCYVRRYILDAVKALLSGEVPELYIWDLSLGQGSGIFSAFKFNPVYLLAVFVPETGLEIYYNFMNLFFMVASGIALRAFLHKIRIPDELGILVGSLMYVVCCYSLFSTRHIIFRVYFSFALPLLLYACEGWIQNRKWGLYVFTIFSLFLGGYYVTWVNSLLMALYLLARFIYTYEKNVLRILQEIFKMLGLYLTGMALSMFSLLPSIVSLTKSGRVEQGTKTIYYLYKQNYYRDFFTNFVGFDGIVGTWTQTAFPAVTLLCIIVLFFKWRDDKKVIHLRLLTLFTTFCLLFPLMGLIFNGFVYISNRWCFGYAVVMAAVIAYAFPKLFRLTRPQQGSLALWTIAYILAATVKHDEKASLTLWLLWMAMLAGALVLVLLGNHLKDKALMPMGLCAITVVGLMLNIGWFASQGGTNGVTGYFKEDHILNRSYTSAEAVAAGLADEEVYRTETLANYNNVHLSIDGNGTSRFCSIVESRLIGYYLDFDLASVKSALAIGGLDGRSSLTTLAGVKYYLVKESAASTVPYGYEYCETDEETGMMIFRNTHALSLGYTYEDYITEEAFEALTPLERQQALVQTAVVSGEDAASLSPAIAPRTDLEVATRTVPFEVVNSFNAELSGNTINVTEKDGFIDIVFDTVENCEMYLYFVNPVSDVKSGTRSYLTVSDEEGLKKACRLYETGDTSYIKRNGVTYNLGYEENTHARMVTISFDAVGSFSFDDIRVEAVPMDRYVKDVTARSACQLNNVKEEHSGISGTIDLPAEQLLVLAVPYASSWTLTVDGQRADYFPANRLYVGTVLPAGQHDIALTYSVPGFIPGVIISGVTLLGLLGVVLTGKRKSKRKMSR